jgi:membrane protease YdiL (CAAX protease family)
MSATIIALLVFSLLQKPLGFWPALIVGFVAGILARAALLWVERIWLRAVVRRARSRQAEQSGNGS